MNLDGVVKRSPGAAVSVVIVNWNTCEDLGRCLRTLFEKHPDIRLRIIIVDNGSSDGSVDMIRRDYPQVELIANQKNLGFAAANNQAFSLLDSQDPFILVLNPDVIFTADTLGPLIDFLECRPEIGVVTPRILNPDGTIQRGCRRRDPRPMMMLAGFLGLSRLFPTSRLFSGYTYGDIPQDKIHEIEAASGSFLLFRREVLEKTGGFDERFFLFAEDLDWCLHVRRNGYCIYYYPEVSVIHRKGAGNEQRPLARLWNIHYTAFLYIVKNKRNEYGFLTRSFLYLALFFRLAAGALFLPLKTLMKLFSSRKKKDNMPI